MKIDDLDKISGVLGGAIALVTLIVSALIKRDPYSSYILFVLGGLLILVWITWVTKRLSKIKNDGENIDSFIIQNYETKIEELKPISEGPNPWVWEKFVNWNTPFEEAPRAAFLGHIYGHNCAQVVITIGFINQQGFTLFVYNPSKQTIKPVELNVKVLAMK